MKLLITLIRNPEWESVSQGLIQAGFRVTRISSTGGILRSGMSTLIIGVEDDKVDTVIDTIRVNLSPQSRDNIKRATIFVINVEDYQQI